MAFNPGNFQVSSTSQKYMPVVLLLDVSGSMGGEKINNLYTATTKMIETFSEQAKNEIPYKVAIITFGDRVDCHTRYTDAKDLQNLSGFTASGMTPLGTALRMAKAMIDDKDETKSRWYKPAVILVSDGKPTDSYEEPMRAFIVQNANVFQWELATMLIMECLKVLQVTVHFVLRLNQPQILSTHLNWLQCQLQVAVRHKIQMIFRAQILQMMFRKVVVLKSIRLMTMICMIWGDFLCHKLMAILKNYVFLQVHCKSILMF